MAVLTSKLIVELLDRITGPAKRVSAAMTALTAASERNSARLVAMQGRLLGAAAAGYGLARGLASPIKAGANFQTMLEDIRQKSGVSGEALSQLGRQLRDIATATNQLPTETIKTFDGLMGLGLGGTDEQNVTAAVKMLPAINKVATAYRAAADDVMRAGQAAFSNLKVPADQVIKAFDAMAQSGKAGAFELKDMATYFPELTAQANALGMKGVKGVADIAAALQVVRQGAGDSSKAANNLKNVMQKILSPVTVGNFKKFGINFRKMMDADVARGASPIETVVALTEKAMKKGAKIGDLFGDQEAQLGMLALLADMKRYREIRAAALNASGTVEADFAERIKTADAAMTRFRGSIENLNISISAGLLPTFERFLNDYITPAVKQIGRFAEENKKLTTGIVGVTAGLIGLRIAGIAAKFAFGWMAGGALLAAAGGLRAFGAAVRFVGLLLLPFGAALRAIRMAMIGFVAVTAILGTGGALKAAGAAMLAFLGPIGLIAAAVVAAGVAIYAYWDDIKAALGKVNGALTELTGINLFEAGKTILSSLWEGMKSMFSSMLGWVKAIPGAIKGALGMGGGAAPSATPSAPVAGARAAGGPVQSGKSYLVGERGPELFRAPSSGNITNTMDTVRAIKAEALAGAAGRSGGGNTINAPITMSVTAAPGQSTEAIAEAVERKFSAKLAALSRGAYSDGAN